MEAQPPRTIINSLKRQGLKVISVVEREKQLFQIELDDSQTLWIFKVDHLLYCQWPNGLQDVVSLRPSYGSSASILNGETNELYATSPGVIHSLLVEPNCVVEIGQPIVVIECMKMQIRMLASSRKVIESVDVAIGDQIKKGQVLVHFKK